MIYFLFFDGALGQYFVIEGDEDWGYGGRLD